MQKLSNDKRMDVWTVTRTILKKSPGIKAKELIKKVGTKSGLSRSTIYEHLRSWELQGKYHRAHGKYWLTKPKQKEKTKYGFFEWLKDRSERKRLEREKAEREMLAAKWTYLELLAAKYHPEAQACKDWVDLEKKKRKEAGLE